MTGPSIVYNQYLIFPDNYVLMGLPYQSTLVRAVSTPSSSIFCFPIFLSLLAQKFSLVSSIAMSYTPEITVMYAGLHCACIVSQGFSSTSLKGFSPDPTPSPSQSAMSAPECLSPTPCFTTSPLTCLGRRRSPFLTPRPRTIARSLRSVRKPCDEQLRWKACIVQHKTQPRIAVLKLVPEGYE